MIRYTGEQKTEALKKAGEVGVSKASEELGINKVTLYAWRKAANEKASMKTVSERKDKSSETRAATQPSNSISQPSKKRRTRVTAKPADSFITLNGDNGDSIRSLLHEDDGLRQKVQALEAENAKLLEKNARLKTALAALIDS